MPSDDTIFALASGQAPAAIAIVRVSGPLAAAAVRMLAGDLPRPRTASLRALRDPLDGVLIDRALLLFFQGPGSVTGEDLVELHLHGGRAVIAALCTALGRMEGLRPALAGEFTRRALMAGRIDLAEAEGLGDLLAAETEGQRRAAMAAAEGLVSRSVNHWRDQLLLASAMVEASLDFSDEDDVGADPVKPARTVIRQLATDIAVALATPPVERLRDGVRVVLAGSPNAGKSTLFNRLADRDAAIVSPIAGTTRDRIDAPVLREGIAYLLTDTAGLVDRTADPIEAIGVARAREALAAADIVLWLDDAPPDDGWPPLLWLWPRADVRGKPSSAARMAVSAATGEGIDALWLAIADLARSLLPRDDQVALNARQRGLISHCGAALEAGLEQPDVLLLAEDLRVARGALDRVTGAVGVEDVLDTVFGRFCIGK